MFTGTGDANTDVGAHLMGFLCGLAGGVFLVRYRGLLTESTWQRRSGLLTAVAICGAWLVAFMA